MRFAADTPPIPRRPPPDMVVDFCRQHGLRMHGHTLVWNSLKWSLPDWLPKDPAETERLLEKRIREIAERYGLVIKRWDVLNEPAGLFCAPSLLDRWSPVNETGAGYTANHVQWMPADYERKAFAVADRYFPKDVRFNINEATRYWYPHKRAYADRIRRLMADGVRIVGIGLQFHLFTDEDLVRLTLGERFTPRQLFETLDVYAQFQRPIHISEITLTAPGNSPKGLAAQADAARKLYRLWFSDPLVEGITWWNVPDGGAAPGEDTVFSGPLFADLSPKPAYTVIHQLLHEEWRTEAELTTDATGTLRFCGFHGRYALRTDTGTEAALTLEAGQTTQTTLCL